MSDGPTTSGDSAPIVDPGPSPGDLRGTALSDGTGTPAIPPDRPRPDRRPRPLVERIGMAAIALVIGPLFGVVAIAAFQGGEPFLGVMGAIGCLMVLWVGALTLFRG